MADIRINRFLSMCGLGSRRHCEDFVLRGRVSVNGAVVGDLAFKVNPEKDRVEVGGRPVRPLEKAVHLMLNKPAGVVVSKKGYDKKSVFDLLSGFPENLTYAGRLDAESEGLLVFSTNGDLINRLTHPRYKISKIYIVHTDNFLSNDNLSAFRQGLPLDDGATKPAQIEHVNRTRPVYRVILNEGRNRQIRRMMEHMGRKVIKLERVAFGPLRLGNLKPGHYRELTKNELGKLKRDLGLGDL